MLCFEICFSIFEVFTHTSVPIVIWASSRATSLLEYKAANEQSVLLEVIRWLLLQSLSRPLPFASFHSDRPAESEFTYCTVFVLSGTYPVAAIAIRYGKTDRVASSSSSFFRPPHQWESGQHEDETKPRMVKKGKRPLKWGKTFATADIILASIRTTNVGILAILLSYMLSCCLLTCSVLQ